MSMTRPPRCLPAGRRATARTWSSRRSPPAGATAAWRSLSLAAGESRHLVHRRRRRRSCCRSRALHGHPATARRFDLAGRADVFDGATDFAYVPRDAEVDDHQPRRRALRAALGPLRARLPFRLPARRRRTGRAARRRAGQPPGQQLLHARGVRGRRAHRLRGADAGRQLVVVPAAQARRGDATTRASSRRSTTSRSPTARPGPGMAYQRVYGHAGQGDRRARRGAQRRRRADPARLARPVDGGPRATTSTTST